MVFGLVAVGLVGLVFLLVVGLLMLALVLSPVMGGILTPSARVVCLGSGALRINCGRHLTYPQVEKFLMPSSSRWCIGAEFSRGFLGGSVDRPPANADNQPADVVRSGMR